MSRVTKTIVSTAAPPRSHPAIDAAANRVVVGPRAALESDGLVTGPVNWLLGAPPAAGRVFSVPAIAYITRL